MFLTTVNNRFHGKVREEEIGGVKYLVAPVVMIREGVLSGSNGSIMYTANSVKTNIQRWNNMPLVLNHPEKKGRKISARSPEVIDEVGIGFVFNTKFTKGALKAEAWFDISKTEELAPNILKKVRRQKQVELSTGLFTKTVNKKGSFKDKKFDKELVAYEPDHLAILTNEKGACSLEDGCGVNTNSAAGQSDLPGYSLHDLHTEDDDVPLTNSTNSKISHEELREALTTMLRKTSDTDEGEDRPSVSRIHRYVSRVFDDKFIYVEGNRHFQQDYKKTNDGLEFVGDRFEVAARTEYKKVKSSGKSFKFLSTNGATVNASKCGAGGGKGRPGFQGGNSCAKGSGRAGFGKAKTATAAQKKSAKKRSTSSSSSAKKSEAAYKTKGGKTIKESQIKADFKRDREIGEGTGTYGQYKKSYLKDLGAKKVSSSGKSDIGTSVKGNHPASQSAMSASKKANSSGSKNDHRAARLKHDAAARETAKKAQGLKQDLASQDPTTQEQFKKKISELNSATRSHKKASRDHRDAAVGRSPRGTTKKKAASESTKATSSRKGKKRTPQKKDSSDFRQDKGKGAFDKKLSSKKSGSSKKASFEKAKTNKTNAISELEGLISEAAGLGNTGEVNELKRELSKVKSMPMSKFIFNSKKGTNCGIDKGGFQRGNKCGGSGGKKKSSKTKKNTGSIGTELERSMSMFQKALSGNSEGVLVGNCGDKPCGPCAKKKKNKKKRVYRTFNELLNRD